MERRRAITALEVAIVVIILVAVAIVGVKFYLGKVLVQKRVEQTRSDLRAMATAVDARFVDWSMYPVPREYLRSPEFLINRETRGWSDYEELIKNLDLGVEDPEYSQYTMALWPRAITTPVAYLSEIPIDPLDPDGRPFGYMVYRGKYPISYLLVGCGPDEDRDLPLADFGRDIGRNESPPATPFGFHGFPRRLITYYYDPTNGLKSDGDIIRLRK